MIVLFTDFGLSGPYIGQMKAVLHRLAPGCPVIDLFADAPAFNIRACAHLLANYAMAFPQKTVFLAVVDPGVGTAAREPVVVKSHGRWFVGPGNGLFDTLCRRDPDCEQWRIVWQPEQLSSSFHGRDLFAPVAAMLATDMQPELAPLTVEREHLFKLPTDLDEIIYIDHFGNLFTGLPANAYADDVSLRLKGKIIPRVDTFAQVPVGEPLCYENANGLIEIAVNQGRADRYFKANIGDKVVLVHHQCESSGLRNCPV